MGMFDSFYDENDGEWQTKAFGRSLHRWDIGETVAPSGISCQVEAIGVERSEHDYAFGLATIRGGVLIAVPDERDESLTLIPYGGLGATYSTVPAKEAHAG